MVQIPTTSYVVLNRDTLTSIAAKFETTPTELTHLNKLNSSFIYPGQTLQVPDKSASIRSDDDSNVSDRSSPLLHNRSAEDGELVFFILHLEDVLHIIWECPVLNRK